MKDLEMVIQGLHLRERNWHGEGDDLPQIAKLEMAPPFLKSNFWPDASSPARASPGWDPGSALLRIWREAEQEGRGAGGMEAASGLLVTYCSPPSPGDTLSLDPASLAL